MSFSFIPQTFPEPLFCTMDSTEHLANKEMTPWGPLPAGSSLSSYYNSVEEEEQW